MDEMVAPPNPARLASFNIEIGGRGGAASRQNQNTISFPSPEGFGRVVQSFVHLPTKVFSRAVFFGPSGNPRGSFGPTQ